MTYEKWLELLKKIETSSHQEDIESLKNEPFNENINPLLVPKIKDMIIVKFNRNISYIINDLENIFIDENELDLALVSLKKNVKIIISLIKNNQLNQEQQQDLLNKIKESVEKVYKNLYTAAFDANDDGVFNSIINKNRIKWSDENEL